jgi:hypothetical protein
MGENSFFQGEADFATMRCNNCGIAMQQLLHREEKKQGILGH